MNGGKMKIAIIGAGPTGLSAAWELSKQNHEITIFEKEAVAGGLARGFKARNWQDSVECFYHHWFKSDQSMLALIEELGLVDQVKFHKPVSVMYYRGKFYPFDTIPSALLFPGLGFGINKIRFGLVGLYLRMTNNWRAMEKFTVEDWMTKYAGEKVYRSMWEPMMIGKFGEHYASKVNMAWMWARIHSRTTELGTFKGGFQAFFDAFTDILRSKSVELHFNAEVESIRKEPDRRFTVKSVGSELSGFDRVLVTTSPHGLRQMVPELPQSYQEKLRDQTSMGAVVMVISIKHPLSPKGYYWYNLPKQDGFPCLALVEHTNFVSKERFDGETIIYAGDYLEPNHENFRLSKDELLAKMLPGLKQINPEFDESWVNEAWKFSAPYAQPIPLLNHSQKILPFETPLDGMFLATMSQIYPWDRGVNYAFQLGKDVSRVVL
jgi:protoporphyrinogen oxidase